MPPASFISEYARHIPQDGLRDFPPPLGGPHAVCENRCVGPAETGSISDTRAYMHATNWCGIIRSRESGHRYVTQLLIPTPSDTHTQTINLHV